jgi:hypothetical protein
MMQKFASIAQLDCAHCGCPALWFLRGSYLLFSVCLNGFEIGLEEGGIAI